MPIRPAFSMPWDDFVAHWCLGIQPAFTEAEAASALAAIEHLLPDYLDQMELSGQRGLLPTGAMVHFGLMLSRTQSLPGFPGVLQRVKERQASACSELECAAGLVKAGLRPELGAPLAGKVLDATFLYGERSHYVEVIAPDRSEAIREAGDLLAHIATEIAGANRGASMEVLLNPSIGINQIRELVSLVSAATMSAEEHDAGGLGRFIKEPATSSVISPRISNSDPGPVLAFGTAGFDGQVFTVAAVRLPIDDLRAQRTFAGELHHFSRNEANLIVMDVTRVIGGSGAWKPLIERCFQPTRNTRIGAVVLFEKGTIGPQAVVWERWTVARNPHARVPLSDTLLHALASLDYGPYPGA
jgi:hypothetical protein